MRSGVEKTRFLPAGSWCLYDFANTIYSGVVVTLAFQLHLAELTGKEKYAFWTLSAGLIASGLAVPACGAIADRTGQSKRYLIFTTAACCVCTIAMSATINWPILLVLYFITTFAYNTSLVFYESLVVQIAERRHVGRVTGLGVGLGYLGTAFALPIALWACKFLKAQGRGIVFNGQILFFGPAFVVAGLLFLIFSIPLIIWVPERRVENEQPLSMTVVGDGFGRLLRTLRNLPANRNVMFFLLANFFCLDTVNALIACFMPFVKKGLGLTTDRAALYMILFSVIALGTGMATGWMADRWGSKRVLAASMLAFLVTLLSCAWTSSEIVFAVMFLGLGTFALAGTWTAGRKLLVTLAPPDEIGEYFGLYGITAKLSIVGNFLFGWIADMKFGAEDSTSYRVALSCLLFSLLIGMALLTRVKVKDSARDIEGADGAVEEKKG